MNVLTTIALGLTSFVCGLLFRSLLISVGLSSVSVSLFGWTLVVGLCVYILLNDD